MSLGVLEPLRHTLIAAQLFPEPALRRLALARYDHAWRTINTMPERAELHERLYRMLPSDWPLWVEHYRPRNRPPEPHQPGRKLNVSPARD